MIASTCKINLEIVAYLLIKLLKLFTSKIRISLNKSEEKKRFHFDFMSFWMALLPRQKEIVSSLERGVKIFRH